MIRLLLLTFSIVFCSAQPELCAQSSKSKVSTNWEIKADKVEHPSASRTIGKGNVEVSIDGQDAILKSAEVNYDEGSTLLRASGSVEIIRKHVFTAGTSFAFKAASPEYLVTEPDFKLGRPRFKSRKAGAPVTDTGTDNFYQKQQIEKLRKFAIGKTLKEVEDFAGKSDVNPSLQDILSMKKEMGGEHFSDWRDTDNLLAYSFGQSESGGIYFQELLCFRGGRCIFVEETERYISVLPGRH